MPCLIHNSPKKGTFNSYLKKKLSHFTILSMGNHNSQGKSNSQFHKIFLFFLQNHSPRKAISQFTKTMSPRPFPVRFLKFEDLDFLTQSPVS